MEKVLILRATFAQSAPRLPQHMVGSLKINTALEYSTRVVQEGDRRCKKSTLNDLAYLTPLRIPLMNPAIVSDSLHCWPDVCWLISDYFNTGFIRGILRGVRYAKSLRVLFLHRRSPSWTTLVMEEDGATTQPKSF